MAQSVMQKIRELSQEKERLLAREASHHDTPEDRQRLLAVEHKLQVLWDLRRRELAGAEVDLEADYYDAYTITPGDDAPGGPDR